MPKSALAGSRIRDRRLATGQRQADLARACGISPSYLNLIEHNRRRIGGKLLVDIAAALEMPVAALARGAEDALLESLQQAAQRHPDTKPERDQSEEFAGRFSGWARLIAAQEDRITELERTTSELRDRLTHDPFVQASVHEVLSAATAVRATAAILNEAGDISAEWLSRFHRNMLEDAGRMVEASQELVTFLDEGDRNRGQTEPERDDTLGEVDACLAALGYNVPALEVPGADIDALVAAAAMPRQSARTMLQAHLTRYASDAAQLPLDRLKTGLEQLGPDPFAIAALLGLSPDLVMRRMAHLPAARPEEQFGLLITDGTGQVIYRRPLAGFSAPRFEEICPIWPLDRARTQPGRAVVEQVTQLGRQSNTLWAYAYGRPEAQVMSHAVKGMLGTMLLVPSGSRYRWASR
ncbi:MAG: helix-turn-helix domain-containing protein [Pseudomonadota bacterium]